MLARTVDTIQRREGGRILAGLIRFCGSFDAAEDALQEAYARAMTQWPKSGLPTNPAAWLTTVAQRVAVSASRRQSRLAPVEEGVLEAFAADAQEGPETQAEAAQEQIADDQLRLIFTCCHPALAPAAQAALALKTICQLSVTEIARAYLEPEATTAQRLVRAKRKIAEARIPYAVPACDELPARLDAVLSVIYLVFNEGYTATESHELIRKELCREAIRLGQLVTLLLPAQPEAMGLLAMMQLHDARRPARTDAVGQLVPLDEQDRRLWNHAAIADATELVHTALRLHQPGAYQVEAAIAALHCNAPDGKSTDWEQISVLYGTLWQFRPTEIVALNAAVAHALAFSIDEGLARIERIAARGELAQYHLLHAARADLLRRKGDPEAARAAYARAITLCANAAEKSFLQRRADELR